MSPKPKCRFCQRPLRNLASISLGYGPVCGKKVPGYHQRRIMEERGQLALEMEIEDTTERRKIEPSPKAVEKKHHPEPEQIEMVV